MKSLKLVITPHTSSGQVREMLRGDLPIECLIFQDVEEDR